MYHKFIGMTKFVENLAQKFLKLLTQLVSAYYKNFHAMCKKFWDPKSFVTRIFSTITTHSTPFSFFFSISLLMIDDAHLIISCTSLPSLIFFSFFLVVVVYRRKDRLEFFRRLASNKLIFNIFSFMQCCVLPKSH